MKKVLYTIGACLLLVSVLVFVKNVLASDTLIASKSEAGATTNYSVGRYQIFCTFGDIFTPSSNAKLTSVKMYISKYNSSSNGTVTYKIYNTSSGLPTTLLATSDTLNVSTISTSASLVEIPFSGSNQINLVTGTTYAVVTDGANANTIYSYVWISGTGLFYSENGTCSTFSSAGGKVPYYIYGITSTGELVITNQSSTAMQMGSII